MPKRDARARWGALINEFESGSEPAAKFCARRGLAKPTFYMWRRRLGASEPPVKSAAFVPVHVARPLAEPSVGPTGGGVEIVLCGGRRLRLERGFDPAVLAAALAALEGAA